MEHSKEKLEQIAELFKILSDVTRIQIIYRLTDKKCVSELAQELDMTDSAVSHQLRILKASRLVVKERKGKQIYYCLSDDVVKAILRIAESRKL